MTVTISKIKGTGVLNQKKYVDKIYGHGSFDKKVKDIDPNFHPLILASNWYNIDPIVEMFKQLAEQEKKPLEYFALETTKFGLENDLNGVYKFLMKLGGTKRILTNLPSMVSAYTNFTQIIIQENTDTRIKFDMTTPTYLSSWAFPCNIGGVLGILETCKRSVIKKIITNHLIENSDKAKATVCIDYN